MSRSCSVGVAQSPIKHAGGTLHLYRSLLEKARSRPTISSCCCHLLLRQLALLWSTRSAAPAPRSLRLAVPVNTLPAANTPGLPPAFRHVTMSAAYRPGSDLDALLLPHLVVPVARTDQGMGDLVQDRVPNFFHRVVPLHEVDRKPDDLPVVDAQAHRLLAAIEPERPTVKAVLGHQVQCHLLGVP